MKYKDIGQKVLIATMLYIIIIMLIILKRAAELNIVP